MFAIGCYIKKSVKQCNLDKYMYPSQKYFNRRKSYDNKEYICKTCHSKVIKGKLPCQAVINDMYIDEIPQELASLAKLEQILVSKRIVFQKIIVNLICNAEFHDYVSTAASSQTNSMNESRFECIASNIMLHFCQN